MWSSTAAITADIEDVQDVSMARKRRWEVLNPILDNNKKSKSNIAGSASTPYSFVSWSDIENIYRPIQQPYIQESTNIEETTFSNLFNYLRMVNSCFDDLRGKEAKRMYYICPIIVAVCSCFNGEVKILVEEDLTGKRVHGNGHFEMILQKGNKRICIVEAKKDDMEQGLAQCLVGCEVVSDVEKLNVVYGIVTTYQTWELSIVDDTNVKVHEITLDMINGMPTEQALRNLTGKIYRMLSDTEPNTV